MLGSVVGCQPYDHTYSLAVPGQSGHFMGRVLHPALSLLQDVLLNLTK